MPPLLQGDSAQKAAVNKNANNNNTANIRKQGIQVKTRYYAFQGLTSLQDYKLLQLDRDLIKHN